MFCGCCQKEVPGHGRYIRSCKHIFHLSCIVQWIKTKKNEHCPVCRTTDRKGHESLSQILGIDDGIYVVDPTQTPLMQLLRTTPSLEEVTKLLKHDPNINACDKDGWTALHFAAVENSAPGVIAKLVEAGADLTATTFCDDKERTPLGLAVEFCCPTEAITLLESGAVYDGLILKAILEREPCLPVFQWIYDRHTIDKDDALLKACCAGNLSGVQFLLDVGGNPNCRVEWTHPTTTLYWTPVFATLAGISKHGGAYTPFHDIMQLLTERGAVVNANVLHEYCYWEKRSYTS